MASTNKTMNVPSDRMGVRALSDIEIDDVSGGSWVRDAINWVKKHVRRGPGKYGIAIKGTHDIGK